MTNDEKLREIVRLLDEAYAHYFEFSDGYCKSSEGYVELTFGTYFDRRDGTATIGCNIWSYVFGEGGRQKFYDSLDAALAAVRKWHAEEMADDHADIDWSE